MNPCHNINIKMNIHSKSIQRCFFRSTLGVLCLCLCLFLLSLQCSLSEGLLQVHVHVHPAAAAAAAGFHTANNNNSRRSKHKRQSSTPTRLNIAPQQLGTFESLQSEAESIPKSKRRVVLEDLLEAVSGGTTNTNTIDFETAWNWQKFLVQQHVQRLSQNDNDNHHHPVKSPFLVLPPKDDTDDDDDDDDDQHWNQDIMSSSSSSFPIQGGIDTVFLLEHDPIYTLGTGSDETFILGTNPNVPTIRMDRGGEGTIEGFVFICLIVYRYCAFAFYVLLFVVLLTFVNNVYTKMQTPKFQIQRNTTKQFTTIHDKMIQKCKCKCKYYESSSSR